MDYNIENEFNTDAMSQHSMEDETELDNKISEFNTDAISKHSMEDDTELDNKISEFNTDAISKHSMEDDTELDNKINECPNNIKRRSSSVSSNNSDRSLNGNKLIKNESISELSQSSSDESFDRKSPKQQTDTDESLNGKSPKQKTDTESMVDKLKEFSRSDFKENKLIKRPRSLSSDEPRNLRKRIRDRSRSSSYDRSRRHNSRDRNKRNRSNDRSRRNRSNDRYRRSRSNDRTRRNRSNDRTRRNRSNDRSRRNRSNDRYRRSRSNDRTRRNRSNDRISNVSKGDKFINKREAFTRNRSRSKSNDKTNRSRSRSVSNKRSRSNSNKRSRSNSNKRSRSNSNKRSRSNSNDKTNRSRSRSNSNKRSKSKSNDKTNRCRSRSNSYDKSGKNRSRSISSDRHKSTDESSKKRSFKDFIKNDDLYKGFKLVLKNEKTPTDLQEKILTNLIKNSKNNLFIRANVYSGKELAYLVHCFKLINPDLKKVQVVIILPTTELTHQFTRLAEKLTKYTKIDIKSTVNDDDITRKINYQMLLTTCGGFISCLFNHREIIEPKYFKLIVFEELDLLVGSSKGRNSIRKIIEYINCPSLFFSSSLSHQAYDYVNSICRSTSVVNSKYLDVFNRENLLTNIDHYYRTCSSKNKCYDKLLEILSNVKVKKCLVFAIGRKQAFEIQDRLKRDKFRFSSLLSSDISFNQRVQIIGDFKSNDGYQVLIVNYPLCVNIEIDVDLVINFDLPSLSADSNREYYHKLSPLCRLSNKKGYCINIINDYQFSSVKRREELENYYHIKMKRLEMKDLELIE